MNKNAMHLNLYLARSGLASRRKAIDIIKAGHVMVNGKVALEPYVSVQPGDTVKVGHKLIKPEKPLYFVLNKPAGFVCSNTDEKGRNTIFDLFGNKAHRLFSVGRLDIETTGALLVTNDGDLAQKLAHPKFIIKKTYEVKLDKPLEQKDFLAIKKGIKLHDGIAQVDAIRYTHKTNKSTVLITLHSGKNRIIKRIFQALCYRVKKLDRIAFATINKKGLKRGGWRPLTSHEITALHTLKNR